MEKSKMKYVRPKTIVIKMDMEDVMCGVGLKDSNNRDPDTPGYGGLSKRAYDDDPSVNWERVGNPWSDEE